MNITSKRCRGCGADKPLDEFYAHSQMSDGRLNYCKPCVKVRVGIHRETNLDVVRAYDRKRGLTPKRKAKVREYQRENPLPHRLANIAYIERYPQKNHARVTLNNAVRDGRVIKLPCEVCGDRKSQGHHENYSKPLDVIWLCAQHHGELHRNKNELARAA